MAEYISTVPQAVAAGGNILFQTAVVNGCGSGISHRNGSGIVKVKGSGNCCRKSRYHVSFNGTVSGLATAITAAIYLDGEALPETAMAVVPAAAADVWSISAEAEIYADYCCSTISVKNTTDAAITVNTAEITVTRTV